MFFYLKSWTVVTSHGLKYYYQTRHFVCPSFCICVCPGLRLSYATIFLGTSNLSISSSSFLYLFLSLSSIVYRVFVIVSLSVCISWQSSWGQQTCQFLFLDIFYLYLSRSCIFRPSSWRQQTCQFLILDFHICICLGLVFSDNSPGDTIAHPAVRLIQCGRWWEYWTWNDLLSGSQKEYADFISLSPII